MGGDFVEQTGLGLPFRLMTKNGSVFQRGEMFKGSYEVGIYIMALTAFIRILNNGVASETVG